MVLTDKDVQVISETLNRIRNTKQKKYEIENLCDKASLVLTKASRRHNKPVRLVFRQEDFE